MKVGPVDGGGGSRCVVSVFVQLVVDDHNDLLPSESASWFGLVGISQMKWVESDREREEELVEYLF